MFQSDPFAFVLDVDGVLTSGEFYYSKKGKILKAFGADDFDMLDELRRSIPISFITADKKGWDIVHKRLVEDCHYPLHYASGDPYERWETVQSLHPNHRIIFMGDGCKDFVCLSNATFSITTCDAMAYNQEYADYVTKRPGGQRAVAEACIAIAHRYKLETFLNHNMHLSCAQERHLENHKRYG